MSNLKKLIFILFAIIIIESCKSKQEQQTEKLKKDLITYFNVKLKDSTSNLDSFKLIKVDTITQQMYILEQSRYLGTKLDYLIDLYEIKSSQVSNSVKKMQLYGMIESNTLVDIERKELEDLLKEGKEMKVELDTVLKIVNLLNTNAQVADSVKPVGFQAKCLYQIRFPDQSIKRDTLYIFLNINKDIIEREDFFKIPYKIDFDKYN